MSILNKLSLLLESSVIELIPIAYEDPIEPKGQVKISNGSDVTYQKNVRDCKEHSTLDDVFVSTHNGLKAINLSPYTKDGKEWNASFNRDLNVGEGGIANIQLRDYYGNDVTNAHLQIELYKNTKREYEISSRIIMT